MEYHRGKLIAIYGPNNVGKTKQVKELSDRLLAMGIPTISLKYPVYHLEPTGPALDRYLRQRNPDNLDIVQAQSIYAHNRRDFEPKLRDFLTHGIWVVAEDYVGTGIAWGATFGAPLETLEELNRDLLKEDLAICIDGIRFMTGIERGHLYEESESWDRSKQLHLELAERYSWEVVRHTGESRSTGDLVWEIVRRKFAHLKAPRA